MQTRPMKKAQPDPQAAIDSALRTVATEQAGIEALAAALRDGLAAPFARAVDIVSAISGRVIVTGVGKSGHIGSKVAATLASTGTPAFFVHPVEANHGDLGMIADEDAIIALSWSGESPELKGLIAYSRRFSIPLIAITAGKSSALARAADVVLLLPRAPEACPHGLAPTTSTLLQLVTGDALAIALLEARGFTPEHFRTFHPGGQLGANLTRVFEIMRKGDQIPLARLGTRMPEAVMTLAQKKVGLRVRGGRGGAAGRHLHRRRPRPQHAPQPRRDHGGRGDDPHAQDDRAADVRRAAIALLNKHNISALVVTEGGTPVGVVHFHDLLRIGAA